MSIASNLTSGPYVGNGSQTAFAFTFTVAAASEIRAQINGADVSSSLYTVALNADGTGTLTFSVAPANGASVLLISNPSFAQESIFESEGDYSLDAINAINRRDGVRANWLAQILAKLLPTGWETITGRAGKFLGWDAGGNPVALTGTGADAGLRTDLAASGGAALIGLLPAGTGAVASTVQAKLRVFVSVKDFGAVGNGVANDTAAIQAAITYVQDNGGGDVFFPAGTYKITAKISVTKPNVRLFGTGDGSLIVPTGDFGDVIHAYPATGPNLQGFRVESLYIYTANDTTSGAQIRLENCNGFRIDQVRLAAHFGGIHVDGSVHGYIDADIQSDANFAALRTGSYLFKATKSGTGTIPAEIHVAKSDWRGQNGNNYLNYAVLIQCADGIWFDQPHWGFAKVGLALNPGSNTDTLISIVVRGGYLDTCGDNLLQAYRPSASYSADWGLHHLDFATQYNSGGKGWDWFCLSTGNNFWSTIQLGTMLQLGGTGVDIGKGKRINILDGFQILAPSNSTAGQNGITLQNDVSEIRIGRGTIDKFSSPNTPANGIQVTASVDKFDIERCHIIGCTSAIADVSVTANKSVTSAVTW